MAVVDGETNELLGEHEVPFEEVGGTYLRETNRLCLTDDAGGPGLWALDLAADLWAWGLNDYCYFNLAGSAAARNRLYCTDEDYNMILVADLARRRVAANLVPPFVESWTREVCVSNATGKAYVLSDGHELAVLVCEGDTFTSVLRPDPPVSFRVAASAESAGVLALAAAGQPEIRLLDCHADTFTRAVALPVPVDALIADPDGVSVYAACDMWLAKVNTRTGRVTGMLDLGDRTRDVCVATRQNKLYVAGRDRPGISVVARSACSLVAWVPTRGAVTSMQYGEAEARLFFACAGDSGVWVLDCCRDSCMGRRGAERIGRVHSMSYSAHGGRLYVAGEDSVYVFDCQGDTTGILSHSRRDAPALTEVFQGLRVLCAVGEAAVTLIDDAMPARRGVPRVRSRTMPTVARHTLNLGRRGPAYLYDRTGRLMTVLGPGENDVSRLRSGVYFLRRARNALSTKVIIAD